MLDCVMTPGILSMPRRSTIINVDRIREMRPRDAGEYDLILDSGKQLTMSRGCRTNLKRLIPTS